MKHTIELKMPKLFGKKKKFEQAEESSINTEVTLDDIKETIDFKELKEKTLRIGIPIAVGIAGIAIGHVAGFNKGVIKGLDSRVIVVNRGELN